MPTFPKVSFLLMDTFCLLFQYLRVLTSRADMAVVGILSPGVPPGRTRFTQSLSRHFTAPVWALRCWPGPSATSRPPCARPRCAIGGAGREAPLVGGRSGSGPLAPASRALGYVDYLEHVGFLLHCVCLWPLTCLPAEPHSHQVFVLDHL